MCAANADDLCDKSLRQTRSLNWTGSLATRAKIGKLLTCSVGGRLWLGCGNAATNVKWEWWTYECQKGQSVSSSQAIRYTRWCSICRGALDSRMRSARLAKFQLLQFHLLLALWENSKPYHECRPRQKLGPDQSIEILGWLLGTATNVYCSMSAVLEQSKYREDHYNQ